MPPLRLLFCFAHPDDESMGMGALIAKYAAEGVEVFLVCATRGERGWQGDEINNPGLEGLGTIRTNELMNAAKILGLNEVSFLDYIDGDLDQVDHAEAINKIATHIRRVQPHVVVTFAADGAYGHPDHIAISQFTSAAVVCAADSNYADSDKQPPHRVSKLYYCVDAKSFVAKLHSWDFKIEMEIDGLKREHVGWEEWMITTRIDADNYWRTAYQAVLCHATQIVTMKEMLEQFTEEQHRHVWGAATLYRVYSLVNGGRKVETDLFEGLR